MDNVFSSPLYFGRVIPGSDDIIEDSEPERQEKKSKRLEKQRKSLDAIEEESDIIVMDVTPVVAPHPPKRLKSTSPSEPSSVLRSTTSLLPSPSPRRHLSTCAPDAAVKPANATSPNLDVESDTGDVICLDLPPTFDLARFAFKAPSTSTTQATTLPVERAEIRALNPRQTATRSSSKSFLVGVDFSRVLKCPACQVSWTIRKSADAKATHIRTCSKKNGIAEDAIAVAIVDHIASNPVLPTKGRRQAQTTVPPQPQTFMETIIDGAAPKKRKIRPKEHVTTVKPAAQVHGSILRRADAILESPRRTAGEGATDVDMPATQSFTRSGVANAFRRPPTVSPPSSPSSTLLSPAATKLPVVRASEKTAFDFFDGYESPTPQRKDPLKSVPSLTSSGSTTHDRRILPGSPILISSDEGSTAHLHPSPAKVPSRLDPAAAEAQQDLPEADQWSDASSEGCLYWDNFHLQDQSNADSTLLHQFDQLSISPPPSAPSFSNNNGPAPLTSPSTRKRKTAAKKRTRTNAGAESKPPTGRKSASEVELFEAMERLIIGNDELHCRILRYEPIDFEVFISLAATTGLKVLALDKKLRLYLDAAGIIFYEKGKRHR